MDNTIEYTIDGQRDGELLASKMKIRNGTVIGPACVYSWQMTGWKCLQKLGDKVRIIQDDSYLGKDLKVYINNKIILDRTK